MLRVHAMYNRSRRVMACSHRWGSDSDLDALGSDDALLGEISQFNPVKANNMLAFSIK